MKKKLSWLPKFCHVAGIALLAIVIGLCLPITLPRLFGYQR